MYLCTQIRLKVKMIWMFIFWLLPLLAIVYIGWHVWCLLPCSWIWKLLVCILLFGSFLLLFSGLFFRLGLLLRSSFLHGKE